jgi:putative membrane protein
VKDFAQRMITDHTGVNKQATALVKKLKVTPEESDTSKSLKDGGATNIASLKKMKGDAFDKAYIDHEVTYHQAVLDTIDKTLLPNAKNAELKDLIEKVRPAIDAHLQHAKQIQASLK